MNARITCSIAAAVVLAAGGAFAQSAPRLCTTDGGGWTITVLDIEAEELPDQCFPVPDEASSGTVSTTGSSGNGNGSSDGCTGLRYTIVSNQRRSPDHVVILAEHDISLVVPPSTHVSDPCVGDSLTALGTRDCSTQAVRLNANPEKRTEFDLVAEGTLQPVSSSIAVKSGRVIESCRIASLGVTGEPVPVFSPEAQVTTSETFNFKNCEVTITTDLATGESRTATLSQQSKDRGCVLVADNVPAGRARLVIDIPDVGPTDIGALTFGEGFISSGGGSCSTRSIFGKITTMCTCTSASDPRPPCLTPIP